MRHDAAELDPGAMIWSEPAANREQRPLLVMMHGAGGVEQDLAQNFGALPDGIVAVSVRAPLPVNGRWSWAAPEVRGASPYDAGAEGVLAWLDSLLGTGPIGLFGFSQGGAMVVQLLRRAPARFACAVQVAGFLPSDDDDGDAAVKRVRPPVLSAHGELDDVIPGHMAEQMSRWLRAQTSLVERRYPGTGHEVSPAMVRDAMAFIGERLQPQ